MTTTNTLDEARVRAGLTWDQVATAAGISPQALRNIRRGATPRTETARRLEEALGLPAGHISTSAHMQAAAQVVMSSYGGPLEVGLVIQLAHNPRDLQRFANTLQAIATAMLEVEDKEVIS